VPGVAIRGVLFDFSGTLFHLEYESACLAGLAEYSGGDGVGPRTEEHVELMGRLTAPLVPSTYLPEERRADWQRRDLDPALHRDLYLNMLVRAGLDQQGLAERLYDRLIDPAFWKPYPDTEHVLRWLARSGVPVAVVSNIAWDIRAVFRRFGVDHLVSGWVLSYEEGRMKPDAELFRTACARIGVPAEDVLMIGDSEEADGGAAALGSSVAIVDPLPAGQRPDALVTALRRHGVGLAAPA
jgi:HAD superfamily hydrolase (TIGR01509 family)